MKSEVASGSPLFPDPVLTASLYCDGRLDEIFRNVLAPFRQELGVYDAEGACYLWTVRYARRGEHLKIRLHGPEERRPLLQSLLEDIAGNYFAALGPPEQGAPRQVSEKSPPIDTEDSGEGLFPDRTLLWTGYKRSHVSLAGEPFLLDDHYVALFTRCAAAGCNQVIQVLQLDSSGIIPPSVRPSTLLKMVIDALSSLQAEKRAMYLAYHRDWLIRFTLLKRHTDPEQAQKVLTHLDHRLQSMAAKVEATRRTQEERWEGNGEPADANWRRSFAALSRYAEAVCQNPDYHIDPFARDPRFAFFFKVLHGLANQLGLSMMDEAFVHHLLLRAAEGMAEPDTPACQIDWESAR